MKGALNRVWYRAGPCTDPCARRKRERYLLPPVTYQKVKAKLHLR